MRYATVCSGIEAPTVAWHPLGWEPVFFSEIEKFPSAVLAYRWPVPPNLGDMIQFREWPDAAFDVFCGGTPCQSFSVAGLRKGLADPRGNLTLTFLAIAARYRPRWLVWENVPGVLSDASNAFGCFLGGLAELGYGWAYRILDAQYAGVPQRRRRVFVVGHLGDWRRAAAVLFERHSLQWHPAPSRETREGVAPTISARTQGGGGLGTDFDCDGGLVADTIKQRGGNHAGQDADGQRGNLVTVALPVTSRVDRGGAHREAHGNNLIAYSLRADGFDASEDGTGRGTPLVPTTCPAIKARDSKGPSSDGDGDGAILVPVAFSAKDCGADAGDLATTLRAGGHTGSHANAGVMPAIAFGAQNSARQGASASASVTPTLDESKVPAISFNSDQSEKTPTLRSGGEVSVATAMQVRRLTPRECERLQGFEDNYTLIPWRGKMAPDGPRYKALGNSMAVPVVRWIGQRIAMVDACA